ncbi:A disintegrin and metalloproteinase with thrombospondin motifs 6 [Oopsacas minuta]|uniref:A disintegrin and metalloproteinase with thrombospondin motifs 6 n=1 Tax=Oopsacas minuta TaxID=111878 RepID=A0AAV7K625_9METZ|nr:A disintegrin and metalloproteinase with thrombospondin motifs 6 [Oopsacas minuta]
MSLSEGTHYDIDISLEVLGDHVILHLTPNLNLQHNNYVYQHLDDNNNIQSQNGFVIPCHYTGTVECIACHNSHTFVSTCNGHLRGLISINNTDYYIEPLIGSTDETHFVYTNVSPDNSTQSELLIDKSKWLSEVADSHLRSVRSYAARNKKLSVETLVVLDETILSHHGSLSQSYALTVMNIVSGLLARPSLGQAITLVVTRLIVSQSGTNTFIWNSADPDTSLSTFCGWQHQINGTETNPSHDLAVLLTRHSLCRPDTHCSVIGVANIGGLCSGTHSCLIVKDEGVMLAGTTVTHEIGHLFGLYHDENPHECGAYNIRPSSYIMTEVFTHASNHFTWSECSKHSIVDFLSRGGDTCLLNEPTNQIVLSELPLITADQQCQSILGANSRVVASRTSCATLVCSDTPGGTTWQSLYVPMIDGTNCSIDRNTKGECQSGVCVLKGWEKEPINGEWSQWSEWSDCSHTCDLALQHRERKCGSPPPSNGGNMCLGDRRQYTTCKLSKCATSEPSRRDRSCERIMYQYPGTWRALSDNYNIGNPCKLFCQNSGSGQLAALPLVTDGTECHAFTPDRAMCVLGNCVAVDCNGELAGGARLDACGVCGGDGTTCHIVIGTIREYLPSFNLHNLISIPQEARDLTILNLTPRPYVYLAVTQSSATRLLRPINLQTINGVDWRSATLSNGSATFSVPGPISNSLELKVFGGPTQVALYYSYLLPPDEDTFTWRAESTCSDCNATCGNAVKYCVAECVDVNNNPVSPLLCDPATKPLDTFVPCPDLPDCPTYVWTSSGWSLCSATCGSGVKTRTTFCLAKTDQNFQLAKESNCVLGSRPLTSLSCYQPCVTPTPQQFEPGVYLGVWVADEWGECLKTNCVAPEPQHLQIECRVDGNLADQSDCDPLTKPAPQQRDCPQECIEWETRRWRVCDTNCRRQRIIRCLRNGQRVPSSVCNSAQLLKPKNSQRCKECSY